MPRRILVTGANGHLGRRLIERFLGNGFAVSALVRSERARQALTGALGERALGERAAIEVLDYADVDAVAAVARGCDAAVHLVGIIKESSNSRFEQAHEDTTRALVVACDRVGIGRVVYLSIAGADLDSANACFASKARAEQILLESHVTAVVLRIPMVLGEDDYATRALRRRARARLSFTFRASSLEQPIYAGDVAEAVLAGLQRDSLDDSVLSFGGAESLSRRALFERAGAQIGRRPTVVSLPLGLGLAVAWLLEKLSRDPPVTRAMLGVLDHDDDIDNARACRMLGITVTGLDETLAKLIP